MTRPLRDWSAENNFQARILVMEDDVQLSDTIGAMLAGQGHRVTFVADADQGMSALQSSIFDLVLIDMFIPGKDGLKTIREIRQMLPFIPIVAMSELRARSATISVVDVLGMAAQLGATSSLRMPFTPAQLKDAIAAGLNHARYELNSVAGGYQR